jgi:bacillithiol biosynthesis deacetylase BshB1
MKLDCLAFGAHPDDIEITCGGTLIKLSNEGYQTGVVDLTKGEMGTRGTPEIRQNEAMKSAEIMKLSVRENLEIPDGNVQNTRENQLKVISMIRKYRPTLIIAPWIESRHPDHSNCGKLVTDAWYLSGLYKIDTGQEVYRAQRVIYFYERYFDGKPSFIVDITKEFDTKLEAIKAHKSQFYNPDSKEPETILSSPGFFDFITTRLRYYGELIDVKYGEPFIIRGDVKVTLAETFFKINEVIRP